MLHGAYFWYEIHTIVFAVCGLFLTLDKMKQPPSPNGLPSGDLQGRVSQLERELRQKTQENQQLHQQLSSSEERRRREVAGLQGEVREKGDTITRLDGEVREKGDTITRLQGEVGRKEAALSTVFDQLTSQRENHNTELRQVRLEAEQCQQQLREHQLLVTNFATAISNLRGEPVSPQALEMWELPREEVHISQTLLGTGGWGYVARGTFRGQTVAVKCLHRAILSPENEGRLRREISIMSQVRHPNLLLLIGAVLTAEGEGPLIVTELLDTSLRSAYEGGSLEERSKVPVLRDVASALTYPHPHPPQRRQQCQRPLGSHRSRETVEGQAVRLWVSQPQPPCQHPC